MSAPTQTCGDCLRFDRNTMPNLQHLGKCKFCDLEELAASTKACEHSVTEIKIQRERTGFYVYLLPCGEREGPFPTDSLDHVKLAAKLGLKPNKFGWLTYKFHLGNMTCLRKHNSWFLIRELKVL